MRRLTLLLALAILLVPMSLHAGCKEKLMKSAKTKADSTLAGSRCSWQSKIRMTPSKSYGGKSQLTLQYYFKDVLLSSFKADTAIAQRKYMSLPDSVVHVAYDTTITTDDQARDLAFSILKEYLVEEASQGSHYLYAFIRNLDLQPVYDRYLTPIDSSYGRLWYLDLGDSATSILLVAARIDEQLDAFHVFITDTSPAADFASKASSRDIINKIVEQVGVKTLAETYDDARKGQACEMRHIGDVFFEPRQVGKTRFSILTFELTVFVGGTDGWAYVFAVNR